MGIVRACRMTDDDLLDCLVVGEWVSGAKVGRRFGVTRNAVCKHAANLRRKGWRIDAAGRLGMRLVSGPK